MRTQVCMKKMCLYAFSCVCMCLYVCVCVCMCLNVSSANVCDLASLCVTGSCCQTHSWADTWENCFWFCFCDFDFEVSPVVALKHIAVAGTGADVHYHPLLSETWV